MIIDDLICIDYIVARFERRSIDSAHSHNASGTFAFFVFDIFNLLTYIECAIDNGRIVGWQYLFQYLRSRRARHGAAPLERLLSGSRRHLFHC